MEWVRLLVLGLVAAWLLYPFATSRLIGAGDAYWYANMLADFVTQLRAGVFPIFVGQSEYAFNGAVYPLRVAPLYQHLGGLIDLVTGHTLGFYTLQHLTVIVCGVAGIYSAYSVLCRISPDRRWPAMGLSILYLSCPGILGTIYAQDQYMTWMTVPLAPWVAYGIARSFSSDNWISQLALAAPLAALWWAHSPIALWFTGIAVLSQLVRLVLVHRGRSPLFRCILGFAVFLLLAHYPFVSLAELRVPGGHSDVIGTLAHRELILKGISDSFPADLQPLTPNAQSLSDLQLGYGLAAVLLGCLLMAMLTPSIQLWMLVASALALFLLLVPVPGLTAFLWWHLPESVVRITYYWPMQRFYLIVAALLAVAGQIAQTSERIRSNGTRAAASTIILFGCAWSMWETRQFRSAGAERTASSAMTSRSERPENRPLMNHAYGLFPSLPARFTNGVVDPLFESRLVESTNGQTRPTPARMIVASGRFSTAVAENPGILDLSPAIRLEPKHRYELAFEFPGVPLQGILQFTGTTFFREYALPQSGEALAFGSGPSNSRSLGIWSTDPDGDTVTIHFIPSAPGFRGSDIKQFGAFVLYELDSAPEPVEVISFIPYAANVTAPNDALLETSQVFIPGYTSTVDGATEPVRPSAAGLVSVPVTRGKHHVQIEYHGTLALRFSYWLSMAAWLSLFLWGALRTHRFKNSTVPSQ
jgi:hypothetical protein